MSWEIKIVTSRPVTREHIAAFDARYPEHRVPMFIMDDGSMIMSGSWTRSGHKAVAAARMFAFWLREDQAIDAKLSTIDFPERAVAIINRQLEQVK